MRRLGGHRDQSATFAQDGERTLEPVPSDRIEDEVDLPHDVLEPRRGVVDHLIGPELARGLDVARRAGPDHGGAALMRELDRESTDPAGRSVDEHALAF